MNIADRQLSANLMMDAEFEIATSAFHSIRINQYSSLRHEKAAGVHFDFTYVKSADYAVFFAVLDSSSDLLLMGWGVQTQPVRLFDFLF